MNKLTQNIKTERKSNLPHEATEEQVSDLLDQRERLRESEAAWLQNLHKLES